MGDVVRKLVALIVLLGALVLGQPVAPSSAGELTWSEPVMVSLPGQNTTSDANGGRVLAVGPGGAAVAVWGLLDDGGQVWAARRVAGASEWSTPERLSTEVPSELGAVAIDASGRAISVWTEHRDGIEVVVWSRAVGDGEWSAAAPLSDPGHDTELIDLAVDDAGGAMVVLAEPTGLVTAAFSTRVLEGSTWGQPTLAWNGRFFGEVVSTGTGQYAGIAVTSAYQEPTVQAVSRYADGVWQSGPGLVTTPYEELLFLGTLSAGGGRLALSWVRSDGYLDVDLMVMVADAGIWGPPVAVASGPIAPGSVVVDRTGRLTTLWGAITVSEEGLPHDGYDLRASSSTDGISWSPSVLLMAGEGGTPAATLDAIPDGGALAVWGLGSSLWSSAFLDGSWSTPTVLAPWDPSAGAPSAAVDTDGHATVLWGAVPLVPSAALATPQAGERARFAADADLTGVVDPPDPGAPDPDAPDTGAQAVAVTPSFTG